MNNRIRQEMNKIDISDKIHERSKTGIKRAESSMKKQKLRWFYLATSVLVAASVFTFISPNNMNQFFTSIVSKNSDVKETHSYAALVKINEKMYLFTGEMNQGKYTISEKIGGIKGRVSAEVIPNENLVSNYLDEGSLIYSVKEDSDIYLVKTKDEGDYEIVRSTDIGS